MKSIYSNFRINDVKTGKPIDFLGTMQIMFDQASLQQKTLFEQTYTDRLMEYKIPQLGLTAEGIMGRYGIRIRASVIGNDAATPLRAKRGFEIWTGEIPRFGHKFPMDVKELRALLQLMESPRATDQQKLAEILKIIKGEYKDAYLGCKDVTDEMILKAISHLGVATFSPTIDNPDGRMFEIDYGMPEENIRAVTLDWSEENLLNPKVDVSAYLQKIVYEYNAKGIPLKEIWMAPDIKYWLLRCFNIRQSILGKDKNTRSVTEVELNNYLQSMKIPPLVEINKRTAYEKDGRPNTINPWDDNVIAFIPQTTDGKLGVVQPAVEDNEILPDPNVQYTNADHGIRIAKWTTGESTGQTATEYTQASWRAVPIITCMNGIVSVTVRGVQDSDKIIINSGGITLHLPEALVIVQVQACEDPQVLLIALARETARPNPRSGVITAIESRYNELKAAGSTDGDNPDPDGDE